MADLTVSADVDSFMQAAHKAAMRTVLDTQSNNVPLATARFGAAIAASIDAALAGAETAVAGKAPLANAALTGVPTVPTASPGTNTTQAANTAFVQAAIAAILDSTPAALDTLNELAAALGDDPNFATTVTNAIAGKVAIDSNATLDTLTIGSNSLGAGNLSLWDDIGGALITIIPSDSTLEISSSIDVDGTVSCDFLSVGGLATFLGALRLAPATMAALAIDTTKCVNIKSITSDVTMTFANPTPSQGTRTELRITTDSTARTVTIPSCYSFARNSNITSVVVPANSTMSLAFEYTGSRWEVYGDPVATSGTVGKYVLVDDSTPPTDGQVMKWVAASSKWVPANDTSGVGGGGSTNVWVPASALIPKTTSGCGVNSSETTTHDQNYDTCDFDTAADEFADFMLLLPNNWSYGTITARFYWTADSGSGTVNWAIRGRAFGDDDALDQAGGTAQAVTDTLIAAGDMHVSAATSAVTLAGTPAANKPAQFTVYRDVSEDTLGVDARLIGVEIIYT